MKTNLVGILFLLLFSAVIIPKPTFASDSYPGCTLVNNTTSQSYQGYPATAPAYLTPYTDPIFHTQITRISKDSWGDVCRHHYSKDSAWNADGSLLWLNKGCNHILDGNTYQELTDLSLPSYHDARWHPTDSNLILYVSDNRLASHNVRTGQDTTIRVFDGYGTLDLGPWEGNFSQNGQMVALVDSQNKGFAYNLATNTKYPDKSLGSGIDWISISASGKYIVYNGDGDHTKIYDLNWNQIGPTWDTYGCPSHFDLTYDLNGDEVAVGVCKSSPNAIIKRRLTDGQLTAIGTGASADHTSARNIQQNGWAYVSNPWYAPYKNEVLAIKLDGSTINRLAYIPNTVSDYLAEPQAVVSPDGSKLVIASNWGTSSRPIRAYVIEICPGSTITPANPSPTSTPEPWTNLEQDYSNWLSHYPSKASDFANGDYSGDGQVDGVDYVLWLTHYDN